MLHRELTDVDINKIVNHVTHLARRHRCDLKSQISNYQDILSFCKSATTAEIAAHGDDAGKTVKQIQEAKTNISGNTTGP